MLISLLSFYTQLNIFSDTLAVVVLANVVPPTNSRFFYVPRVFSRLGQSRFLELTDLNGQIGLARRFDRTAVSQRSNVRNRSHLGRLCFGKAGCVEPW